jgi:hypothetical protein
MIRPLASFHSASPRTRAYAVHKEQSLAEAFPLLPLAWLILHTLDYKASSHLVIPTNLLFPLELVHYIRFQLSRKPLSLSIKESKPHRTVKIHALEPTMNTMSISIKVNYNTYNAKVTHHCVLLIVSVSRWSSKYLSPFEHARSIIYCIGWEERH